MFLWALAHGMWIGAGWHASQHGAAQFDRQQVCNCSASKATPILSETVSDTASACPVCQLGTVAPDVPVVIHTIEVASVAPVTEVVYFTDTPRSTEFVLPRAAARRSSSNPQSAIRIHNR